MRSMTGYGKGSITRDGREVTFELKSVNHRFLDVSLRLPHSLLFLEDDIRRKVASRLSRGHIDIFATYRNTRPDAHVISVDRSLAEAYQSAFSELNAIGFSGAPSIESILSIPDVLTVRECADDEEAIRALVMDVLDQCLDAICSMRDKEGARLLSDLTGYIDEIASLTEAIEERRPFMVEAYREKLNRSVEEMTGQAIDPMRLAMEVAIIVDKYAINEETARIKSHIAQTRELFAGSEPCGRKLDFLAQEFNREANTISSKSQDIEITRFAMAIKNAIEKFREQLQNVE